MLLKNDRKPAFAYASYQSIGAEKSLADKDFITRMSSDGDDFGNFTSGAPASNTKQHHKKQAPKGPSKSPSGGKKNYMPFVFAGIIVVALIAVIALIVAIFNAPKSNSKIDDTVYFSYIDDNNEYHVVVNGDEIKKTFENEIELIPAADNSFAYILEKVESDVNGKSGIRMHILNGKKLKSSVGLADSCVAFAGLKPGIIYKYKTTFSRYTGDSDDPITRESSAANFIISDNAKTVVYTAASRQDEDTSILKYFQGSGSEDMQVNFTPLAISANGRYIYGTNNLNGGFYWMDAKAKEPKPKRITNESYGSFGEITEMNADGDEIIFYTNTNKGVVSFFYKVKDKSPTTLAQGIFRLADSNVAELAPSTFVGSYFTSQNTTISYDDDGEIELDEDGSFATYCFKKDKAVKVADTVGKFSPDGKYFYYIDANSQLVRTPLAVSDYEKHIEQVCGYITEFALTQKGDVYMFYSAGDPDDDKEPAFLYYWDASTGKRMVISHIADLNSMRICANTLYFSETTEGMDGDKATIVYTTTDGSEKTPAEFKSVTLAKAPTVEMGVGKYGYAYVTDDNDTTMLFFTSNGKKFELVCDSCTLPNNKSNNSGNSAIG